jgi:hypothetical protein
MPIYRFRYVCETSLQFDKDVSLESRGGKILFLFSQKKGTDNSVRLLVDVEAANYRDADVKAQASCNLRWMHFPFRLARPS